jgi:hypothetical protein
MNKKFIYAAVFVSLFCFNSFGQTRKISPTPSPSPKPFEKPTVIITDGGQPNLPTNSTSSTQSNLIPISTIETILPEAEKQAINYQQTFTNLLGEETKTFEDFDKEGRAKNSRVIVSNFIVYQSAKDANIITEYRNITKVDGKSVSNTDKRIQDFFEDLGKSSSIEQELERIQRESSRYDKTLDISGFTLLQAPTLSENIRPAFDFVLEGRETVEVNDVFVISYQQKTKSPYIFFNVEKPASDKLFINYNVDLPGSLKDSANPLMNGKLWIDAKTFQVWREERRLTIQPAESNKPVTINESEFEYQKSDLGILTPKKITFTDYAVKNKKKEISAVKDAKATFEYKNFSKADVEVKSGDVKN